MPKKFEEAKKVEESYKAKATGDVAITIVIGSGQFGSIRVRIGGQKIAAAQERLHLVLGKGADVAGKRIDVLSVVNDVNPMTNRTEVTYTLTGGAAPRTFRREHIVKSDFGVVFHAARFTVAV
jgi:hypothetical protein